MEKKNKLFINMLHESREINLKEESDWLAKDMQVYLKFYENHRPKLIADAAATRDRAVSHRGFHVGCVVMTVDLRDQKYVYDSYSAANFTPIKKEPPEKGPNKFCAERVALERALTDGAKLIPAMVSYSKETNVTRETKAGEPMIEHDVLHPCQDCRQLMRAMLAQGILRPDSKICSVNDANGAGETIIRERSVKSLLKLYKNEDPELEGLI